jgi:hypothetical protein
MPIIIARCLLVLSLGGLLAGCAPRGDVAKWVRHEVWSEEVWYSEWLGGGASARGLSVGYMRPEDRNKPIQERATNDLFYVQLGEPFATRLLLTTGSDSAYPVVVSVFLDYRQVSFGLDGQWGTLHYLEIPPASSVIEIPLEVHIETIGWHDLFVVAFSEPENHPTDPQMRLPPSFPALGRRTVVCVGDCTIPELDAKLPDMRVGEDVGVQRTHVFAWPLLPADDRPAKERLLLTADARPGESFSLELWARNPSVDTRNYVIVPLLDFQQIPFAGEPLLYLFMPAESELFIPGQVQLPSTRGVHELQFIIISDPYRPLEEVRDHFVGSDMRSALIVE